MPEIGSFRAYPFSEPSRIDKIPFSDKVAGKPLWIHFDAVNRTGRITDEINNEIPTVISFWFAWMAFHPKREVFKRKNYCVPEAARSPDESH